MAFYFANKGCVLAECFLYVCARVCRVVSCRAVGRVVRFALWRATLGIR